MEGEFKDCILCGSKERKILSENKIGINKVQKLICTGCGLITSNPLVQQAEGTKPNNRRIVRNSRIAVDRLKKISGYRKTGRLLDISNSYGVFIYFARELGFDVLGLNSDEELCNFAREVLGVQMVTGNLWNTNFPESYFDIVTAHNTLNKTTDAEQFLNTVNKFLKKDGLFFVETDDIESKDKAPKRINNANYYFNHETLKWLLFKAGFEIIEDKENSTTLIARKSGTPKDITLPMPENYEKLYHKLSNYNAYNYYKTKIPYMKAVEKNKKYIMDIFEAGPIKDTRRLTEKMFRRYFPTESSSQDRT